MYNYTGSSTAPWYEIKGSIIYVAVESGITGIGNFAFYNCDNLTSAAVADSVVSVGKYAFGYCESLVSVSLPDYLEELGAGAFYCCESLLSIAVPDGITELGLYTFGNCLKITSIELPDSLVVIGAHVFDSCFKLAEIEIPSGVTSIGRAAFQQCSSLTEIVLPEGITSIEEWTFSACRKLQSITIHEGITFIGTYAFQGCDALTEINIPASVTEIEEAAFNGCENLQGFTVDEDNTAYCAVDGVLYTIDMSCLISYAPGKEDTSYTVPDGVERIGDDAFKCSYYLEEIILPDTVTGIGSGAFEFCTGLKYMEIPDGVTSIENWTFWCCYDLEYIIIPESVTSINSDGSFGYCSSLTDVYFGGSPSEWEAAGGTEVYYLTLATIHYAKEDALDISDAEITLSSSSYTYSGSAKTPAVTVTLDGTELTEDTDFTVEYSDNTDAGTATVTVTGTGSYEGTVTKTFTISAKSISSATVTLGYTSTTYTGSALKPSVTVKMTLNGTSKTLTKGTDYTVTYSNNTDAGTATVKVTGKGNFSGTVTKTFTIKPGQVTIGSAKSSAKKKLSVKWSSLSGGVSYQIAYRVKGGTWSYVTVGSSTYSKTISGLTSGKTYQVQVRAYKTVSGTTYYGSWSSTKTVKVK